jgi:hypothetical protein
MSGISTDEGGRAYRSLCRAADRAAGIVKLGREADGWGLQVILRPTLDDLSYRAAGALFPDIEELDVQAIHLLRWLESHRQTLSEEAL